MVKPWISVHYEWQEYYSWHGFHTLMPQRDTSAMFTLNSMRPLHIWSSCCMGDYQSLFWTCYKFIRPVDRRYNVTQQITHPVDQSLIIFRAHWDNCYYTRCKNSFYNIRNNASIAKRPSVKCNFGKRIIPRKYSAQVCNMVWSMFFYKRKMTGAITNPSAADTLVCLNCTTKVTTARYMCSTLPRWTTSSHAMTGRPPTLKWTVYMAIVSMQKRYVREANQRIKPTYIPHPQ